MIFKCIVLTWNFYFRCWGYDWYFLKKIWNKIEHVIVNASMTHLCYEDFNAQLHYQQEANWCQFVLNQSGLQLCMKRCWMLFTRYGCCDLEATVWGLVLKILVCRDAVQHWGFTALVLNQNGCSVRESPAPRADVNGRHHHDAATSEAPSSTTDAMWRLYWGSLMPVEENTGSTHGL